MNNNLDAGSTKVQRSGHAFCARLTPTKVIVGLLSITLLLLSLIGALVVVIRTDSTVAAATTSTNSVTKRTPNDTSTPTITTTTTPTSTPSLTPTTTTTTTPSPTSTSTPSPTPTTTTTPSPTSTSTPAPTPTATTKTTPSPTSSANSTPTATKTTSPSPTAFASGTPSAGATGTVTTAVTQNSGQGLTPTLPNTNDIQNTSQDQQNSRFPFIAIIIGLLASVAVIFILLIGWWLLRKRLLPMKKVKVPPSGAGPWSRVRTGETVWQMNANGGFQRGVSNNNWVSNNTAPWGYNGTAAAMGHAPENGWPAPNGSSFAPSNVNFPSPYYGVPPATHGFVQAQANNNFASSVDQFAPGNGAFPFNPSSINRVHNAQGMPGPGNPETTRPRAINNNDHEADVYEQWLRNSAGGNPDLNDPYLRELIRQYSDKSRALQRRQKMDRQG